MLEEIKLLFFVTKVTISSNMIQMVSAAKDIKLVTGEGAKEQTGGYNGLQNDFLRI